jgi:capsular polysaccharide biosynthesis protein
MQTPVTNAVQPDDRSDEIEIDLKKYVTIVTSRWRLVLTSIVIASILGTLINAALPSPYEATSTIAIVRTSTQVEFDPRFRTVTQDELNMTAANNDARRATLQGLVENGAIASRVVNEVSSVLTDRERDPSVLLNKVDAATGGRGDLILIRVRDADPQKAATIANAWAQQYERYVNALYSGAPVDYSASVDTEFQRALADFNTSQSALEQYIATSPIEQLQSTISQTRQLIDALQVGRQNALTLVISEQLKVNSEIISAYLGAQSANRLVAFEKEQEGRRNLVTAYLDAQNASKVRVFNEQVRADIALLNSLSMARSRMRQMLGDATAMRDQVRAGGEGAAQSNATALSLMKSQAFALNTPITGTVQLQLQMQDNAGAAPSAEVMLADLNAFIDALEARETSLSEQILVVTQRLQTGDGYTLPDAVNENSRIANAISTTYPLLFDVGVIGQLSEGVPVTNPLTTAAQNKASEILNFSIDNLTAGNIAANQQGDAAIDRLQKQLAEAQAGLEKEQSTLNRLTTDRDLKRETTETLARKQAEVALSSAVSGSEVRLASPALPPSARMSGLLPKIAIASLIGLLAGVLLAFVCHYALQERINRIPEKGAFNRMSRWVLKS